MNTKNDIRCIEIELNSIAESVQRIRTYAASINQANPLKIGDKLVSNGFTHANKTFIAENVFVADSRHNDAEVTAKRPVYFAAIGRVVKKGGDLGVHKAIHLIKIEEHLEKQG